MNKREFTRVKRERECILYNQDTGEEILGIITDISESGIGIKLKSFDDKHLFDKYCIQLIDTTSWNNRSYIIQEPISLVRSDHQSTFTVVGAKFLNIHSSNLESYVRDIKSEIFCRQRLPRT